MHKLFIKISAVLFFIIAFQGLPVYGNNSIKDSIATLSTDTIPVLPSDTVPVISPDTIPVTERYDDKLSIGVLEFITEPAILLSEYIRIESVTGNEREAGMFLAQTCKDMGLHVEIFTSDKDTFNFAASLYPLEMNKPNVILLNHIDVVPAENPELWKHPPFSGAIADGYVWGRGAIDMKGMGIMQLMAMQRFIEEAKNNDFPYNITLLAVSGEETGGHTGAEIVTQRYLDKLNPLVVYNEGGTGLPGVLTDKNKKLFGISIATKRTIWLELTLKMETSGHGSVPPASYSVQEKVEALSRLIWHNENRYIEFTETTLKMFRELGKIERGVYGLILRNMRLFRPIAKPVIRREEIIYSLASNTISVTGIQTQPGPPNQIPYEVVSYLDCRLLPEVTTEDFLNKLRGRLNNPNIKIKVLQEGIMSPTTKIDENFYKLSDALKNVYQNAEVIPILFPASNDNKYFRAKGIPAYGLLPTYMSIELLETIHSIDERLPVKKLEEGIDVYTELIKMFLYND